MESREIRRRSILSFGVFFLAISLALWGWIWLRSQPKESGMLRPLRGVMAWNEKVVSAFLSDKHTAPAFSPSQAAPHPRVNGDIGLITPLDENMWRLKVLPKTNSTDTIFLTMADIRALPKTEVIFDFKCIEGWSQVTRWAGVRFSDFARHYHLDTTAKYAGLETPDKAYYVGVDMASMLHPQTLLCYEVNGQPLPANQGAPLRLIIPVKYGIKSLKRIGLLRLFATPPKDYWAERGYDYFSGM